MDEKLTINQDEYKNLINMIISGTENRILVFGMIENFDDEEEYTHDAIVILKLLIYTSSNTIFFDLSFSDTYLPAKYKFSYIDYELNLDYSMLTMFIEKVSNQHNTLPPIRNKDRELKILYGYFEAKYRPLWI